MPQSDILKSTSYKISFFLIALNFICFFANSQSNFKAKVTSLAGKPIMGASVSLLNTPFKDISDSNGQFKFNDLPEGKYELAITSLGFATSITSITILNKSNLNVVQIIKLADELVQSGHLEKTIAKLETMNNLGAEYIPRIE